MINRIIKRFHRLRVVNICGSTQPFSGIDTLNSLKLKTRTRMWL